MSPCSERSARISSTSSRPAFGFWRRVRSLVKTVNSHSWPFDRNPFNRSNFRSKSLDSIPALNRKDFRSFLLEAACCCFFWACCCLYSSLDSCVARMTGGSPLIFAPIKSSSRSRDNTIASERVMISTDEGVSGPSSITNRTVTLSAEDSPAFRINREMRSSFAITLLSCLPFLPLAPPFRRDANVLRVSSNCPNDVVELYRDEDSRYVEIFPPVCIGNEWEGIVDDVVLELSDEKGLNLLLWLFPSCKHFECTGWDERRTRHGTDMDWNSRLLLDMVLIEIGCSCSPAVEIFESLLSF